MKEIWPKEITHKIGNFDLPLLVEFVQFESDSVVLCLFFTCLVLVWYTVISVVTKEQDVFLNETENTEIYTVREDILHLPMFLSLVKLKSSFLFDSF